MSGAVPVATTVMEAPITTTVTAAPTTSVVMQAPVQTVTYAAPAPVAPVPPQKLTTGMPDPATIAKQKAAYAKMLDDQLKQGKDVLDQQVKYQKEYLAAQAEQQKQAIDNADMRSMRTGSASSALQKARTLVSFFS